MGCIDPFILVLPILGIGWGNPYGLDSEERSIHLLQTNGNLSRSVVVTSPGGIGRINLIGF